MGYKIYVDRIFDNKYSDSIDIQKILTKAINSLKITIFINTFNSQQKSWWCPWEIAYSHLKIIWIIVLYYHYLTSLTLNCIVYKLLVIHQYFFAWNKK